LSAESRGIKMEKGKSSRYCNESRKGRSKSRSGIVCWKCGKKGHLKKDCRSRKGKEGDSQQENNHEANVTGEVLQDALILSFENITNSWVVDSGASFHTTPNKKYFMIMFKEILDKSVWVMINPVKLLEWVRFL